MAAPAEEVILRLNQQISGPASVAQSALNSLEAQIRSEQSALSGLEGSLTSARAKLAALQAVGNEGLVKQTGTIGALEEKLAAARAKLEKLGEGVSLNTIAPMLANVQELTGELEAAKKKLDEMKAAGPKNANAIASQKEKISGLEAKAADKGANIGKLKAAIPDIKSKAGEADLTKLKEAAEGADGPIGKVAGGLKKMAAAGAPGVLMAIVVALVAITAAAIAGAIALTQFALACADAARSSALLSGAAAGGSAAGAELEAVINDVANKTPLARDKIAEMARAMEIAHLQGRNMQNALEATATASAAVGAAAGAAFTSIAENSQKARRFLLTRNDLTGLSAELEGTGVAFADVAAALAKAQGMSVESAAQLIKKGQVSVKDGLEAMNAAVQAKFGKTVAGQMLSLNNQFAKMKEGIGRLFDGVDIEPFLRGLKLITGLFSEQTVTGAALKTLFVSLFNPLAAASEGIFPLISAFLRGMVIAALQAYIAYIKVSKAIKEAFGGDSASKIDWVKTAMYAGMAAVVAIGGAMIALTVIVAVLATGMIIMTALFLAPFILAAAAVYLLIAAFNWVTTTLNDTLIGGFQRAGTAISGVFSSIGAAIMSALGGIDLGAAAGHIMDSLANGITAAIERVRAAMKAVGSAILGALPAVLQMHSPSVLLTRQAEMAAGSVVTPLEDAKDDARGAMEDLGGGRPDFSSGTPGSKGATAGPSRTFTFAEGAIVFNGSRADFPYFRQMFADLIEELNAEGPEPTT